MAALDTHTQRDPASKTKQQAGPSPKKINVYRNRAQVVCKDNASLFKDLEHTRIWVSATCDRGHLSLIEDESSDYSCSFSHKAKLSSVNQSKNRASALLFFRT